MKADTPIFEFVICNGEEGGGGVVYYGLQQVMRDFSMDTYSSAIRWSKKFVKKNREKKKFLIIDL